MNHFLLYLLARALGESLRGRRIEAIRFLPPLVTIRLAGRAAPDFLVVVLSNPGPFCYYGPTDPLAGEGVDVFKRIHGDRTGAAPEPPLDRVLRLPLEKSNHTLSISLHGSSAKIRVVRSRTIVESLDARESGAAIGPPAPPGEVLADLSDETLAAALAAGRAVHGMESVLLEAFRLPAGGLDTDALVDFRNGVRNGTTAFLLGTRGRLGRVVPLPESVSGDPSYEDSGGLYGPFHDPGQACLSVGETLAARATRAILDRHALPLGKRLQSRKGLIDKLRAEAAEAAAFDAERREANILAAYQSQVPAGASEVELPDLYAPGKTVSIRLDPALPVKDQIEKRFKRATKLERSCSALSHRIDVVQREAGELESALAEVQRATSFKRALQLLRSTSDKVGLRPTRPARAARVVKERQYRRFELGPHWFVLVGRNDRENDDITFRVAAPDDIWMHAQQSPGSHIVLKSTGGTGNPSRSVLDAAAGIAAFYSKARHADLVPVIYTLRKYVRKFRGAKPGQVTCEREKTLFTKPRLPE